MNGVYETGLAINCISNIVTQELATDLLPELTNLTSHPQPYLRKKAILCLFKLFVKYPQALRLTFPKIQQCVQDPDPSVVSCAVNVITELSDKNPKNYLPLAPAFFELLTKSSNNWMLIKVVKLLGSLVPEEPRLARKLLEPLATIVKQTKAKSLLFEAVHTITLCLPYCRKSDGTMPAAVPDIVMLCAKTLRDLVEETDQNLKYLGLVGFGSLMQSHPRVLNAPDFRPLILTCLSDDDITIRSRALDLLTGMTSRKNLVELVTQLLGHVELATGSYKHDLVSKIIEMCSSDKYALLQDFAWYLDVLFRIGHMRGVELHGDMLRNQVIDVALRVLPVRPYAVLRSIENLLEREGSVSDDPYGDNGRGKHIVPDILPALAWITGEYADLIQEAIALQVTDVDTEEFLFDEDSVGPYHAIIQSLTDPTRTQKQPSTTQKVYVQAAMKVLAASAANGQSKNAELEACVGAVHVGLSIYMQSPDAEVAERSFAALALLKSLALIPRSDGAPELAVTDDETDDGDLLGTAGEESSTKKSARKRTGHVSVATKLRDASVALSYLLRPAPMKPIGGKVQKKKHESKINVSTDLDQPVKMDLSVFLEFLYDELEYREGGELTIDSVSFTQQQPRKPEERPSLVAPYNVMMSSSGTSSIPQTSVDGKTSFQHSASNVPAASSQRQGDPFYLDAGPTSGAEDDRSPNRFGAIQLVDSDEEGESPRQRKKEKKKKRSKHQDIPLSANAVYLRSTLAKTDSMEVYDSDDDQEDFFKTTGPRGKHGGSKSRVTEFSDLAQVDLTSPLREDEVMPERKHRVVPSRASERAPTTSISRKINKKSKKQKSSKDHNAAVGDLLDLGGFDDALTSGAGTTDAHAVHTNPITSAFDDLLGMAMQTSPVAELPSNFGVSTPSIMPTAFGQSSVDDVAKSGRAAKRPWMKGTIKSSFTSVSPVDWTAISLLYRVYRASKRDGGGLMVSFRIDNHSEVEISQLCVSLADIEPLVVDSVEPGGSIVTKKVGPFVLSDVDRSQDVKGSLQTRGGSVSIKLVLPACFHLHPEENVSLDRIASELASGDWSSHSTKVNVPGGMMASDIKDILGGFFRSAEVSESAASPSTFTFASRSTSGVKVRFLVKVKDVFLKVDVKATNDALAKAIASDIKRLVL
jgi:AP-3 complex subunit delta